MFHLISINCRYSHSCAAQFYLRNELETHLPGSVIKLSQLTINDPYYATLLRITNQETNGLFFSVYIWNHQYVRRLIGDIVRLLPDVPVILGGPQAQSLSELPRQCSVVIGEIEGIGIQFYQDLQAGTLQAEYQAKQGRGFQSPYRKTDFSGSLKNRQLYYESSRGCPFSCSYCLSSASRGVYHKPLDEVEAELTELINANPMIIKFVDRTFNDDKKRALAIWKFLIEQEVNTKYHFEIAPDYFDEEMFTLLSTVPCDLFQFEVGIQSCNEQTLAAVQRRMDVTVAGENIRRLAALDTIHLHVDLILGLPYETGASFADSFNRVFSFNPHYIQLGLLKVLPDTAMSQQTEEFGLIYCKEPPYEVLATRWMDHGELSDLYEFCECVEAFYNNRFFQSLWQYLRDRGEAVFPFFYSLLGCCREHDFFQLARTHKLMNRILFGLVQTRKDNHLLLELLRFDWLRCGHRTLPEYMNKEYMNKEYMDKEYMDKECMDKECMDKEYMKKKYMNRKNTKEGNPQAAMRNYLRLHLPQNMQGVYDYQTRVEFLKQAVFLELSSVAVRQLELDEGLDKRLDEGQIEPGNTLAAFLPDQSSTVMKFNRVILLPQQ